VFNVESIDKAQVDAVAKEFERIRKWQRLREATIGLKFRLKQVKEDLRQIRKAWPGLRFVLAGLMPKRVWWVWGPPGSGPSHETPQDAAGFIKNERETMQDDRCLTDEEREDYRNAPDFTPAELRRLWWPGSKIVRNGWGIKCSLIPRWAWGQFEWDGF
jgi:hypothetical protein